MKTIGLDQSKDQLMLSRDDFERSHELSGAHMKQGCIVIYQSTLYPGATEGVWIPCSNAVPA